MLGQQQSFRQQLKKQIKDQYKQEKDQKETLTKTVSCPVCYAIYNNNDSTPMTLLCGHSVCNSCVQVINIRGQIECPECKSKETYPEGYPKKNIVILNMIQMNKSNNIMQSKLKSLNQQLEVTKPSQILNRFQYQNKQADITIKRIQTMKNGICSLTSKCLEKQYKIKETIQKQMSEVEKHMKKPISIRYDQLVSEIKAKEIGQRTPNEIQQAENTLVQLEDSESVMCFYRQKIKEIMINSIKDEIEEQ